MTLADKVTASRIILAPLFFLLYLLPEQFPAWFPGGSGWTVPALWALFLAAEFTDLLDGQIARRRGEVGDFGKLFDPFADILVRVTYFLCFVVTGVFPAFLLLLVLYREFGILFLRVLMMKKGIAMGARRGGKLKAVTYMIAGALALLAASLDRLNLAPAFSPVIRRGALAVFCLSVLIALLSFADYLAVYRKSPGSAG
jgi:CDP-diacylglycerol--glycerol-3-phosphate 3-phosphatidyltransferase